MLNLSFINRFGLAALLLSLTVSTAAMAQKTTSLASAQGPQQVVVTNTTAQPIPMVGLVTDSDNPARQPFQWYGSFSENAVSNTYHKVITADVNHRLVIEDVAGVCSGGIREVWLSASTPNGYIGRPLPAAFWNGTGPSGTPVKLYVEPGSDLLFLLSTQGSGTYGSCQLFVSGYYVTK